VPNWVQIQDWRRWRALENKPFDQAFIVSEVHLKERFVQDNR